MLRSQERVKVLGTRHCFSSIVDSRCNLLSLRVTEHDVHLAAAARTVSVPAAMKYGQLCPDLESNGFALHNLWNCNCVIAGGIRCV